MQVIRHTRQPKYCIMLGSLVSAVALGLISMGMDQNKESLVNGYVLRLSAYTSCTERSTDSWPWQV